MAPAQNIAKPEDVIATDAQLMVSDRLANCLRSDATVLTNGDGSKTLRFIFFAKQSTGYCGCKSPLVKYVVSYGKPGNPPAGASHRFSGEVDSMTATEQETKLMVPLPASPNNAYGLELGCAN